jgi:DNA topoisomerase VI subunit B
MQKLKRTVFEIGRELEFFDEKELNLQLGHEKELWPLCVLKELIDNALDACENADIPPVIEVEFDDDFLVVRDNGLGLPAKILKKSLNYLKRVSDKLFYVSPTRGQLGNALKTVWAVPFVLNGERGMVEVWSQKLHHTIIVELDRISQKPVIEHKIEPDRYTKIETSIKIYWPNLACLIGTEKCEMYKMIENLIVKYSAFNPHATFKIGKKVIEATDTHWKKWKPTDPTSPHWYIPDTLRSLIAGFISLERNGGSPKTVREFISEFRGLARTDKAKELPEKFKNVYLHDLIKNNDVDLELISELLKVMKKLSAEPKPSVLGVIGREHFKKWLIENRGVAENSFRYIKKVGFENGLPYVLETAFGIREEEERDIIVGLNWSPSLENPIDELTYLLGEMRVDPFDPVSVIVHIAKPRFQFTDRGKGRVEL